MEHAKEDMVASFDFGANGKVELTKTKLIGSVISSKTAASQASGRSGWFSKLKSEFSAKLDQVQNLDIQAPKSTFAKILLMVLFGVLLAPVIGAAAGLAAVLGWFFGAAGFLAMLGGFLAFGFIIWLLIKMWKAAGRAYLVLNVNGTDINVCCEGERLAELESFVQIVKKARESYLDSI